MTVASNGSIGVAGGGASAGSSIAVNLNDIAAGDVATLHVVTNNLSTSTGETNDHQSASDSQTSWTKWGEYTFSPTGAAADGVTVSLWYRPKTGSLLTGGTVTVNFSGSLNDRCSRAWGWQATNELQRVVVQYHTATGNGFGSDTISGLASDARLYMAAYGKEANSTTEITPSTNFTVVTGTRSRSNANAVMLRGEYRLNTSTGETANPTLAVSGDSVGIFVAVVEQLPPVTLTEATATASAQDVAVSQSGGAVLLDAAIATASAQDVSVSLGGLTVPVTEAVASAVAQNVRAGRLIASAATGFWDDTGTWAGGIIPEDGDRVTIGAHTVTVRDNRTVGHSPAESSGTYAIEFTDGAGALVIDSAKLTVRGDIRLLGNTTVRDQLVVQCTSASGELEFDASQAADPSGTNYRLIMMQANSQFSRFRLTGTASNRAKLSSNASGGAAYLTNAGFIMGGNIVWEYAVITRMGDSATAWFTDPWLGNDGKNEMILRDVILDACGRLNMNQSAHASADWEFRRVLWKNSQHATDCVILGTAPSTTGGFFTDCDPDKLVSINNGAGWTIDGTHFYGNLSVAGSTAWASAKGVLLRKTVAGTATQVLGDLSEWYVLLDFTGTNPHGISPRGSLPMTAVGVIFDYAGSATNGDLIPCGGGGGSRAVVVRRAIVCKNSAGGQPGKLVSILAAGDVVTAEHCTVWSNGSGGNLESGVVAYGESYAGVDGMIASVKSNLVLGAVSGGGVALTRNSSSTVQLSDPTIANYNGFWQPLAGTDGDGYHAYGASPPDIFSTPAPGANDVACASEPVEDGDRKMAAWDAALGGAGTNANALAELRKRHEVSGFNTAYTLAALLRYVREGFRPTDSNLYGAGHDGVTIGAELEVMTLGTATATGSAQDVTATVGSGATEIEAAVASAVAQDVSATMVLTVALTEAIASASAQDVSVTPGGITVTLTEASAAAAALDVAVALGAIVAALQEAVAIAQAQGVTVTLGGITVPLTEAVASALALDVTATATVLAVLTEAIAAASGHDVTVTLGGVTITVTAAVALAEAQDVAVSLGGLTATLQEAIAAAQAQDVSVTLGALVAMLTEAIATATAQIVTVTLGGIAVTVSPAVATAEAQDVAVTIGLTALLTEAIATAAAQAVTVTLGGLVVTVAEAVAAAAAQDVIVSSGLTATLEEATATAEAQDVAVALGGITVPIGVAIATATGEPVAVSLGGIIVPLGTATATALAQDVAVSSSLAVALQAAVAAATAQDVAVTLGAITAALSAAVATAESQDVTVVGGTLTVYAAQTRVRRDVVRRLNHHERTSRRLTHRRVARRLTLELP